MRILLATGIFAPEQGGPATYTPALASQLTALGHHVHVITYANAYTCADDAQYPFKVTRIIRRSGLFGKLINYLSYFFAIYPLMRRSDVVYTLDWLAAGLPILCASRLLRKKFAVRVGGDYIWEMYLQQIGIPMSLRAFNKARKYKDFPVLYFLITRVLRGASFVVFNTKVQSEIFLQHYGLTPERTLVIENPIPDTTVFKALVEKNNEIVFAGRLIVMKNVPVLIRAYAQIATTIGKRLVIIGDGPEKSSLESLATELGVRETVDFLSGLPQDKLYRRISGSWCVVIPSWTDISPNQAYELLASKIPFLISKENFLSVRDQIPNQFSPYDADELAKRLLEINNPERYQDLQQREQSVVYKNDWQSVTRAHITLFNQLCS